MPTYVTTGDGALHRYAGSHNANGLRQVIHGSNEWINVVDDAGRAAYVNPHHIVWIADATGDNLSFEELYTPTPQG